MKDNMSELQAQFEQASQDVNQLSSRPDNQTLLRLYALFKQGSVGDVSGDKPSMTDMVGFAKWSAWNKLKGQTKEQAQQAYVDLVNELLD
jgi:diazepam-binding inhibitor (GABA receptor modulator, acyl-CoA-binding protein)